MPPDLTHPTALALRELALAYPEAYEDFPWGDRVYKVRGKIFLFLQDADGNLGVGTKLPDSNAFALMLPGCTPTGYGLGKAGWVSGRFAGGEEPPLAMLAGWVRESYLAVAPKRLGKQLKAA